MLRMNTKIAEAISIDGLIVKDVNPFIHTPWSRWVTRRHNRLSIAWRAYATLNPVWGSRIYSKHTKLRILKNCMTFVLLYDVEMWGPHQQTSIVWMSSNENAKGESLTYFGRTPSRTVNSTRVSSRRLWRSGDEDHVLTREKDNNYRVAKTWIPESKGRRSRPKVRGEMTIQNEKIWPQLFKGWITLSIG